jgi:predicted cupin superfamily sugar epimerase
MASAERDASYWIERLGLIEHPEGGYFRESYRSTEIIDGAHLPERFGGERHFCTAIYFLLTGTQRSLLHRLKSDELWHFHTGSALTIFVIDPDGDLQQYRLGPDPDRHECFQAVIPAGCWFGALVDDPDGFTLAGCTVAPGFEFNDFEIGERNDLLGRYPQHRELIERLTK